MPEQLDREERFELLGHACPLERYPSLVVPVCRVGKSVVALFEADGVIEFDDVGDRVFVTHTPEQAVRLEHFNPFEDSLFAFDSEHVVSFKIGETAEFFAKLLEDQSFCADRPFLRLAFAELSKDPQALKTARNASKNSLFRSCPDYFLSGSETPNSEIQSLIESPGVPTLIVSQGKHITLIPIADESDRGTLPHLKTRPGIGDRLSVISDSLIDTDLDVVTRYRRCTILGNVLLPHHIRSGLRVGQGISVRCGPRIANIRWELAILDPPLSSQEHVEGVPVGLLFKFSRQVIGVPIAPPEYSLDLRNIWSTGRPPRVLIIANPYRESPSPEEAVDAELLRDLLIGSGALVTYLIGPSKATAFNVLLQLSSERFDVLHFAGPLVWHEEDQRWGLLFSGGDRLTSAELAALASPPRLIFFHSPLTPMQSPEYPASIVESMLRHGSSDVICAAWRVKNRVEFARSFYTHLLDGSSPSVAEAVARARTELVKASGMWPADWAAYQHYTTVAPADALQITGQPTSR